MSSGSEGSSHFVSSDAAQAYDTGVVYGGQSAACPLSARNSRRHAADGVVDAARKVRRAHPARCQYFRKGVRLGKTSTHGWQSKLLGVCWSGKIHAALVSRILEVPVALGRLTLAAFFLAVSGSGALSLAAMIGDTFVKLPPPAGFCELTPQYEFDGHALQVISAYMAGESIKLLAMSADCNQLAEAREGKGRIDDTASYLIFNADMKMPTPFSVASKCKTLRAVNNIPVGTDVDARLASILEKINVGESGSLGVINEDENACYTGTLTRQKNVDGKLRLFINLQANTVVQTKAIMVRRQAVYRDLDTIKAVLAKFKSDVAAFIAANP
jgi:hypothetical protein